MLIEITNLKYSERNQNYWYQEMVGQTFPLMLDTKKGYLVHRPDLKETKSFLVKHKHGKLVEPPVDEIVSP